MTPEQIICPECGRRGRTETDDDPDVTYCSPTNCTAWKVSARFDHETREWVPVESDSPEGDA